MKKFQITAKKGFFKEFIAAFNEVSLLMDSNGRLWDRVKYVLLVDKLTFETTITFIPEVGIEEISMKDFKTLTDLISGI